MLAVGITMFFLGTAGGIKIYRGSKITFAYTMVAFTCAYGLDFVIRAVLIPFSTEWAVYVYNAFWYIYYSLSIQGWIFSI